jgi:hypothetical protein
LTPGGSSTAHIYTYNTIHLVKGTNNEALHYAVFSIILLAPQTSRPLYIYIIHIIYNLHYILVDKMMHVTNFVSHGLTKQQTKSTNWTLPYMTALTDTKKKYRYSISIMA